MGSQSSLCIPCLYWPCCQCSHPGEAPDASLRTGVRAHTWGQTPDWRPLLQAQVVVLEQDHSPARLEAEEQQQLELQQEVERLRSAQVQTERTLEARERAHRQRVRGLEEQVLRPDWAPAPALGAAEPAAPFPHHLGQLGREGSVKLEKEEGEWGRPVCDLLGTSSLWHRKLQVVSTMAEHRQPSPLAMALLSSGSRKALSPGGTVASAAPASGYPNNP